MPQASPMKWMLMIFSLISSQLTYTSLISQSKMNMHVPIKLSQKYLKWMW